MLTVLGRRSSINVQKVAWLLAELQVPHRHIELGGAFGGLDTPEFRMMNPHGKVPVLKDGDHVVWESHAILRYLAARHPDTGFWKDEPAERAQVDQWMEWSETVLQSDFIGGVFWGFYRTPEEQRDWRSIHQSVERCGAHFKLLDEMLADGGNLLGEALTLADITVGVHLYRYFNLDFKRPEIPSVSAWYERLQQRDGYRENVMIPFDELYGRMAF
ncbi:glutathione S-transferase family protein [Hoeflea poritis]|uniref:Glutathione S-transferase family protein n=1 Tax=Hoeflea poritis TaxID=2993659 RepID=A0ABT4VHJ1_9HYPH|nr:glutathione S-transferase family protein [Hoeflea poritis]MDA4844181.1 glutathione S-transferase family protein [Hoeflea poritis]